MARLPEPLETYNRHILAFVFKIIGTISLISSYFKLIPLGSILFYVSITINIFYIIIMFVLTIIRIYSMIMRWNNKELEVRNSPLDLAATLAAKLAVIAIGIISVNGAAGSAVALGFALDELLMVNGEVPLFYAHLETHAYVLFPGLTRWSFFTYLNREFNIIFFPRDSQATNALLLVARSKGLSALSFHVNASVEFITDPYLNFSSSERDLFRYAKYNLEMEEKFQLERVQREHLRVCQEARVAPEDVNNYISPVVAASNLFPYGVGPVSGIEPPRPMPIVRLEGPARPSDLLRPEEVARRARLVGPVGPAELVRPAGVVELRRPTRIVGSVRLEEPLVPVRPEGSAGLIRPEESAGLIRPEGSGGSVVPRRR